MNHKISTFTAELGELNAKLADPAIYSTAEYPKLAKRQKHLAEIIGQFEKIITLETHLEEAKKMLSSEDNDLIQLAQTEIETLTQELATRNSQLADLLTPQDPNDERDVIVEIRAAAGGDEASLFAAELFRMYNRWCENHNYQTELISENPNEVGGFKEVIFDISGESPYKMLKFEAGVHRVQRVPVTESQGRVHTSTVTVSVLPEAEESEIEINPADLRIDVYRSSGHGGQSVNTTDSAVRITHIPTGMVVTCQDEKSQIKNKAKALGVLRSRLLQQKIEEEQKQLSEDRKKLIGSGDRSEKIRTYNFPQDRITDHRIGYSRSNLLGALDGNIDDLIEQLQSANLDILIKSK